MVKKLTLTFLLGIFGLFTTNLLAQEDATIDPADILYWIGDGESEIVFIVNWAEPDTALAWGYRFDAESVTMKTVMDDIAAADYRFSYEANGSMLSDLHFNDGVLDLSLVEAGWLTYLINGNSTWDYFDAALVSNGEYVKIGDTHCGTMVDPVNWVYVYEKEVAPVLPLDYAVAEVETWNMTVYPNPATDRLYVDAESLVNVEIYDMTGRSVLMSTMSVVDLGGLKAGVYFVTVRGENAAKTTKVIVR